MRERERVRATERGGKRESKSYRERGGRERERATERGGKRESKSYRERGGREREKEREGERERERKREKEKERDIYVDSIPFKKYISPQWIKNVQLSYIFSHLKTRGVR